MIRRIQKSEAALGRWQKRLLYAVTALTWLSGATWLYLRYFRQIQGDLGLEANPAQPLYLQIHGAAAMAFLVLFGTLLAQHVPKGWRQMDRRPSGGALVGTSGILILTGWGLYYVGNDRLRSGISRVHWVIGLLLPVLLFLHVWLAHRRSKRTLER